MLFKTKNLLCYALNIVNGVWKKYEQDVIIFNQEKFCYAEIINEFQKLASCDSYSSQKAFHQVIPQISELRIEINNFANYQDILRFKIQQIEKARKEKNFVRAVRAIVRPMSVDGKLYDLSKLVRKLTITGDRIEIDLINLNEDCNSLHELDTYSKIFAYEYRKNLDNYKLRSLKKEIFENVSEMYHEQNFYGASDYLFEFIENTNFATCEYKDFDGKIYQNYVQYHKILDRENKFDDLTQSNNCENYSQIMFEKQKKWCRRNGWTDLFFQEGKWYAFAKHAVIPQEIPFVFTKKEIFFLFLIILTLPFTILILSIMMFIYCLLGLIAFLCCFILSVFIFPTKNSICYLLKLFNK